MLLLKLNRFAKCASMLWLQPEFSSGVRRMHCAWTFEVIWMHAFCLGRAFFSLVRSSVGTHVYERKINVYIGLVLFEKLISNLTIKLRNKFFSNCSKQFHCHQPRIVLANHKSKKELETVAIFPIKFKKKAFRFIFALMIQPAILLNWNVLGWYAGFLSFCITLQVYYLDWHSFGV